MSNPTGLTPEDLKTLAAPFPEDRLGIKVQSFSRDKTGAMLVPYLQHTDVMNRLEKVDPNWTTTILNEERAGDTVYVRMRMTLKGIARENVGEGGDPKAAYSDALKRCAMLFGTGRYLYDAETTWVQYDEARDRFKAWSYDDYRKALRDHQKGIPLAQVETEAPAAMSPSPAERKAIAPRVNTDAQVKKKREAPTPEQAERTRLTTQLFQVHKKFSAQNPKANMGAIIQARYQKNETRELSSLELRDLIDYLGSQVWEDARA